MFHHNHYGATPKIPTALWLLAIMLLYSNFAMNALRAQHNCTNRLRRFDSWFSKRTTQCLWCRSSLCNLREFSRKQTQPQNNATHFAQHARNATHANALYTHKNTRAQILTHSLSLYSIKEMCLSLKDFHFA